MGTASANGRVPRDHGGHFRTPALSHFVYPLPPPVFTIGHSTRSADELLGLLRENGIRLPVDVRRFPGLWLHPHFGSGAELAGSLREAGIEYRHEPDLGGRRDPRPDLPNTAWRNASFRAYADHMDSPEFRAALGRLLADAEARATTVMCAEAVPWRCHRNLIADALIAGARRPRAGRARAGEDRAPRPQPARGGPRRRARGLPRGGRRNRRPFLSARE